MIKISMNEILNAAPALQEISTKPFNGMVTFKIARLIRELDKETHLFDQSRQAIVDKYGEHDEKGNLILTEEGNIQIEKDKTNVFNEEMVNLLKMEIEVNADKIPLESFSNIEISPYQALALDPLIEY